MKNRIDDKNFATLGVLHSSTSQKRIDQAFHRWFRGKGLAHHQALRVKVRS